MQGTISVSYIHLMSTYGKEYVPEKARVYKTKQSSQDAHEAIRPTSLELTPHVVSPFLTRDQLRLYTCLLYTSINIHPALLPSFRGLHAQRQALEAGVKIAGCTVHFVVPDMDAGPIILQSSVPVMDDDTEDTLAARILTKEHPTFIKAVSLFCDDKLRIEGGVVKGTQA